MTFDTKYQPVLQSERQSRTAES